MSWAQKQPKWRTDFARGLTRPREGRRHGSRIRGGPREEGRVFASAKRTRGKNQERERVGRLQRRSSWALKYASRADGIPSWIQRRRLQLPPRVSACRARGRSPWCTWREALLCAMGHREGASGAGFTGPAAHLRQAARRPCAGPSPRPRGEQHLRVYPPVRRALAPDRLQPGPVAWPASAPLRQRA